MERREPPAADAAGGSTRFKPVSVSARAGPPLPAARATVRFRAATRSPDADLDAAYTMPPEI